MTQTLASLGADAPDASSLNETQLLDVYRTMRTIRAFEDRVHDEFATGDIPGLNHPQRIFDLTEGLIRRGYSDAHIALMLGGNFRRALATIWRPS